MHPYLPYSPFSLSFFTLRLERREEVYAYPRGRVASVYILVANHFRAKVCSTSIDVLHFCIHRHTCAAVLCKPASLSTWRGCQALVARTATDNRAAVCGLCRNEFDQTRNAWGERYGLFSGRTVAPPHSRGRIIFPLSPSPSPPSLPLSLLSLLLSLYVTTVYIGSSCKTVAPH